MTIFPKSSIIDNWQGPKYAHAETYIAKKKTKKCIGILGFLENKFEMRKTDTATISWSSLNLLMNRLVMPYFYVFLILAMFQILPCFYYCWLSRKTATLRVLQDTCFSFNYLIM